MSAWKKGTPEEDGLYWFAHEDAKSHTDTIVRVMHGVLFNGFRSLRGWVTYGPIEVHPSGEVTPINDPWWSSGWFLRIDQPAPPPWTES